MAFNKVDCDEKSILLCKLLNLKGYNSCLFVYEKEKHMAVGLKVADAGYYKNGYVFIESTNTFPIGKRGISLDGKESSEEPLIILPRENDQGYYEQFLDVEDCYKEIAKVHGELYLENNIKGKKLLEKMNALEIEKNSLSEKINDYTIKLTALKSTVDSLEKITLQMNCSSAPTEEIYNECVTINEERNSTIENYQDLLYEYETDFKRHNKVISKYNKLVEKFNKMNNKEKSPFTRTNLDLESIAKLKR